MLPHSPGSMCVPTGLPDESRGLVSLLHPLTELHLGVPFIISTLVLIWAHGQQARKYLVPYSILLTLFCWLEPSAVLAPE